MQLFDYTTNPFDRAFVEKINFDLCDFEALFFISGHSCFFNIRFCMEFTT